MDMEYSTEMGINGNDHADGQQNKADSTEVRLLIENSHVGAIIGKGGINSKRIREENNVFLSIMKSEFRNVQERVMLVKGELVSVGKAISMVLSFIVDASAQKSGIDQDGTSTVKLLVHRSAVGAIIGKQGATIKQTQADTGCRIQISQEPLPNSTDKTVTISGPKASVDEALLTVLQQLKDNPLRPGVREFQYQPSSQMGGMGMGSMAMGGLGGLANVLGGSGYGPGGMGMGLGGGMGNLPNQGGSQFGGQGMGNMYGQQQQNQLGSSSQYGAMPVGMGGAGGATSTQKIAIPTVTAGCVIGKMGSTIKDIRMQSGTSISIADPDASAPAERVVTISGNTQGIQAAIYLIRQLVEHYQPPPSQPQY
jgi:predicted RNA-binding protein YlqC (UPF0109 family)